MLSVPGRLRPFVLPALLAAFFATGFAVRVHREMVDFDVYRTAAARAANAEDLYRAEDGHYQYKYLPAFAFPMYPFARLPLAIARVVWFALSCGLLVALVRWAVRALPERNLSEPTLIWLTVLFMTKFYAREINLGQTNLLLGGLLIAALLAAQVDARRTAGVLVGLGVFVKVYAAILLPWLALAAGLSGMTVAALVIAIGLLLPALAYGWQGNLDQIADWYQTVSETTAPNLLNPENVSAAAMWSKWLGPGDHITVPVVLTCLAAIVLAGLAVFWRKRTSDPLYLEFGLLMLLVPILSPQGWDYVLLLGTPGIICLVDRWRLLEWPWRLVSGAAIGILAFTVFDIVGRTAYTFMMRISIQTVAVLLIAVCLVHIRKRGLA